MTNLCDTEREKFEALEERNKDLEFKKDVLQLQFDALMVGGAVIFPCDNASYNTGLISFRVNFATRRQLR